MTIAVEIVGKQFNSLTVLQRSGSTKQGQSKWLCECVCGTTKIVPWPSLKDGNAKSCGCLWRTTLENSRICANCHKEFPLDEFGAGRLSRIRPYCKLCTNEKKKALYYKHQATVLARLKIARERNRTEVLNAYGGKCSCCGETTRAFLAVDHKENDGAAHRKNVGKSDVFYKWLKRNNYPSQFQILCHNCNWGKYVNGGVCPHKGMNLG